VGAPQRISNLKFEI